MSERFNIGAAIAEVAGRPVLSPQQAQAIQDAFAKAEAAAEAMAKDVGEAMVKMTAALNRRA